LDSFPDLGFADEMLKGRRVDINACYLRFETLEQFERWMRRERRQAKEPAEGVRVKGRAVFLAHCAACHTCSEACHIYDLFTYLTGARVVDVHARSIRPRTGHYSSTDNFVVTMGFADAHRHRPAALARRRIPERMDIFVDGRSPCRRYRRLRSLRLGPGTRPELAIRRRPNLWRF
jgi:hypothetical protein